MIRRCRNELPLGGVLATASHGPLRHGYGALRDFCIGIRFVTGDGRRAKGGGRVVKNVAGYDLMKLLIGSYGTLAVITSASFKLFPAPRQTRTFLAEFSTAAEALQFRDVVMRSPLSPMCLELVSPGARKLMRPEMTSDAWVICVRAAGSDTVLARYRKELGAAITRELEGEDENKMWRAIENFPLCGQGKALQRPTCPENTYQRATAERERRDCYPGASRDVGRYRRSLCWTRRGGTHLWPASGLSTRSCPRPSGAVVADLRKYGKSGLVVRVENGSQNPWPLSPPHLASMRAVKQALDPNNVLRGREVF